MKSFERFFFINVKLTGMSVLNAKSNIFIISVLVKRALILIFFKNRDCILKKLNASFIVHFYLGKNSFNFDTFF